MALVNILFSSFFAFSEWFSVNKGIHWIGLDFHYDFRIGKAYILPPPVYTFQFLSFFFFYLLLFVPWAWACQFKVDAGGYIVLFEVAGQ